MAHSEMLKPMPKRARTIPQTTERLHVIPIDQRTTSETRSGPGAASLLAHIGAHATARFTSRLAMLELVPAHAGILTILAAKPGISQCVLAKALGALPSRMVAFVDQLESKGLLERRPNENDRRNYALHLTKAGRAAYHSTSRVVQEHQQALLAGLSRQEQVQLAELLQRVAHQQGLLFGQVPHISKRSGKNSPRPPHEA
ncbi:MAG TPA: MarR family transcriptional regulator [Acidobacteriaceae bacterium]|nr:MarR family transcriptional regulator [Acidobacteriaceae bacterium]